MTLDVFAEIKTVITPTRPQLIAMRRNMLNSRAEFDRDIERLQFHRANLQAGIDAIEAQINQMIDKQEKKA